MTQISNPQWREQVALDAFIPVTMRWMDPSMDTSVTFPEALCRMISRRGCTPWDVNHYAYDKFFGYASYLDA
jgi:hypothetical protein